MFVSTYTKGITQSLSKVLLQTERRNIYSLIRTLFYNTQLLGITSVPVLSIGTFFRSRPCFPRRNSQHPSNYLHKGLDEKEDDKAQIGKLQVKMVMQYKCKVCNGRNTSVFSKLSYTKGIVIVTCKHCQSRHLIADNLGWFKHVEHKNVEEILAAHGQSVKRVIDDGAAIEILSALEPQPK